MAKPTPIIPAGSEKTYERFHFAPAVRVGDIVYCSGVIGADGATVPDDAADEFGAAFAGLAAVLEAAGGSLDDVVEMTSFHVDMAQHLPAFMAAKDAAIGEPYPAWTAIGCTELAIPGARVEIKATAHLG
jgi:enamine deaminase RidA (YjgF/YER057c/UK114 family)